MGAVLLDGEPADGLEVELDCSFDTGVLRG
jgi:hypothetical protein